jgi:hypothetical protein
MYQVKIQNDVQQQVWDEATQQLVDRPVEEVQAEEQALKDAKAAEIQPKIDAYKAAQLHQRMHGGPGPVAEFEIMKITNEHGGLFEVVFEESQE